LAGDVNGIRDALAAGADINGVTERGQTALLLALGPHGSNDAAAYLVTRGADVNLADNGGNTPLMSAAMWVSLPSVRLLLDHGARVNAQAADGATAAMLVGSAGPHSVAVLSLLLDRGADIRIRTKSGRDVFNSMARYDRKDLLEVLRARGVTE
jgi:ankyrin repeat protein